MHLNTQIQNASKKIGIYLQSILLYLLILTTPLMAEIPYEDYGKIIYTIQYTGLKHIDKSELPILRTQIGQRLKSQELKLDLEQLYLTGYFQFIDTQTITKGKEIILEIQFEENPIIKAITFEGKTRFSDKYLTYFMKTKINHPFNIRELDQDKETITKIYQNAGYELSRIAEISVPTANTLQINVSEGYVGNIQIEGLKHIKPYVAHRILSSKTGEVFNSNQLRRDREKLLRLGYFSEVSSPYLSPNPNYENTVDIALKVTERKSNLLNLGFEQNYERVVGFASSEINHVLMHSDKFSTKVQIRSQDNIFDTQGLRLRYEQPWFLNQVPISFSADTWTELRQEFLSKDINNSNLLDTQRRGWDVGFGFPIIDDYMDLQTKYKTEDISPQDNSSFTKYTIRSFTFALNYKSVLNFNNPKKGSYWTFNFEKGGEFGLANLGGLDFTRYSLNMATFFPVSQKSTIGLRSLTGIFVPNVSNIDTFESENFVIGGANSLRGYKETHPFRGQRVIIFNTEYRYDFTPGFQGVLFYDNGKVFDNGFNFQPEQFKSGAGFGFRFFTPVGPFRLDFAYGEDFIIHFSLGQLF